jgi:hypothetical protein
MAMVFEGCGSATRTVTVNTRTVTHTVTHGATPTVTHGATPTVTPSSSVEGPGSASHATDQQFCSTHTCIPNFPNGNGTIVQCNDGEWSHSGGLSGACSDHGGENVTATTSSQPSTTSSQPSQSQSVTPSGDPVPGSWGTSAATYASGVGTPYPWSSGQGCDQNTFAGTGTSCPFAENVFKVVAAANHYDNVLPGSISAYSPATHRTYALTCTEYWGKDNQNDIQCITDAGSGAAFPVRAANVYYR